MTFRLRHEWNAGATVVSATLATCVHCETLRVVERNAIPFRLDRVHFVRRAIDPSSPKDRPSNLILEVEPPCIEPAGFFVPPW